jgi:peptide/nickel transport system substrate-binding protein
MKKLMVALALGAMALGSIAAQAQPKAKDRVVIGGSLEPPVLDPSLNAASAIREITYQNIYESLGRINSDGKIVPGLADSWTISPDGKTYTFKLHPNVKFHNGEMLTAEDVKFSLDRLIAPDSKAPGRSLYGAIEKVEVVDPATVKLSLKAPDAYLLFNLSIADAAIVEPSRWPK